MRHERADGDVRKRASEEREEKEKCKSIKSNRAEENRNIENENTREESRGEWWDSGNVKGRGLWWRHRDDEDEYERAEWIDNQASSAAIENRISNR
jgi:hypothetical protein